MKAEKEKRVVRRGCEIQDNFYKMKETLNITE